MDNNTKENNNLTKKVTNSNAKKPQKISTNKKTKSNAISKARKKGNTTQAKKTVAPEKKTQSVNKANKPQNNISKKETIKQPPRQQPVMNNIYKNWAPNNIFATVNNNIQNNNVRGSVTQQNTKNNKYKSRASSLVKDKKPIYFNQIIASSEAEYTKSTKLDSIKEWLHKNIKTNHVIRGVNANYRVKKKIKSQDPVLVVLTVLIFIVGMLILTKNVSAIGTTEPKIELKAVGTFEKNEEVVDLATILADNIETSESKEILTTTRNVDFETEYSNSSKLPLNEEKVVQQGKVGREEVTFMRTYNNNDVVNDTIININRLENPVQEKIEVGTNQWMADQKIHIGETIYANQDTLLMKGPNDSSEEIGNIIKYYDVTLLDVVNSEWCKVQIFDYIGYVHVGNLTSSSIDGSLPEKSRKQKIVSVVSPNMAVNEKSGLAKSDFFYVLSNNSSDVNHIFDTNAEVFYNCEEKYNINGMFLAAIGIHESGWGTSTIAKNKKNLFGYGAYDSDPYNMSYTFETYEEGIELVARMLVKYYINPPGTPIYDNQTAKASYYSGLTIRAVNTKYASDPNWNIKVYNIMKNLYNKLAP